jgi:hypothetical protein
LSNDAKIKITPEETEQVKLPDAGCSPAAAVPTYKITLADLDRCFPSQPGNESGSGILTAPPQSAEGPLRSDAGAAPASIRSAVPGFVKGWALFLIIYYSVGGVLSLIGLLVSAFSVAPAVGITFPVALLVPAICVFAGFYFLMFRMADGLRRGERYAVYGLCAQVPVIAVVMLAQLPFYRLTLADIAPWLAGFCLGNAVLTWPPLWSCFRNWRAFK